MTIRDDIVRIAIQSFGYRREDIGAAEIDLWCGAYVRWVLFKAGLEVDILDWRNQGHTVRCQCALISSGPEPGDMVFYPAANHYALSMGKNVIIEGGLLQDSVKIRLVKDLKGMLVYSIEPLIERYQMTGVNPAHE